MSWTDERVELLKKLWSDGLSASQIAGAWRHHAQCSDWQGSSAWPVGSCEVAVLLHAAPAQAAHAFAHVARSTPCDAWQHRACACVRIRYGARAGAARQHHPDRTTSHAARAQRDDLSLAHRRSRQCGFLFLRRPDGDEPAVLRLSLARRLSAAEPAARPALAALIDPHTFHVMTGLCAGMMP